MNSDLTFPISSSWPLDWRLVFISTYPPRRCGIGTYTKDLATGMNNLKPERLAEIIALDDSLSEGLTYPWEVRHRIRQGEWGDYLKVLDYLNGSIINIIAIQHEFGIWGGPDGEYIVDFVKKLKKPFIVTFHTILEDPSPNQKRIIQELAGRSEAAIVMLEVAASILQRVYHVDSEKIIAIHHGAPDFPFFEGDEAVKKELGLAGRVVMSSINLISQGKGIEYAIEALPPVVKACPDFLYLVIGQTHPVVLAREGEAYRRQLEGLVAKHRLKKQVRFINQYLPLNDLVNYVRASDFYITPYENMEQISSGSLAYAIAAGKLCISTPYRYALEMLAGGRAYLVEPKNAPSITAALLDALERPGWAHQMRQKCYAQGRKMTWARVGFRHLQIIDYLLARAARPVTRAAPTLTYLRHLTHRLGLLEHSVKNRKSVREGYSVDDNARALVVAIQYGEKALAERYLDFLRQAEDGGKMYCDLDQHGHWQGTPGVGDWFGRAFWAAAYATSYGATIGLRNRAATLVRRLLPAGREATSLRTLAYLLLGLVLLEEIEWEELASERRALRDHGLGVIRREFESHRDPHWRWPEPLIHYDNPRLAQALLEVGRATGDLAARELGLELLDFLLDHTFDILGNHFRFVGNGGWYRKGAAKAQFDEQPIEAGATVQACVAAYSVTGLGYYKEMAEKALAWYHGDNYLRRPLYNQVRGSVYDGITHQGLNLNQGAESILGYLLAYQSYAKLNEEGGKVSA